SLASRRSGPVYEVVVLRDRAQGVDLQSGRVGQVLLRGARGPDVERLLLVPGRDRAGTAARALRRGAASAGKRETDRSRKRACAGESGKGEGLHLEGPLLVQGCPPLRGAGSGLDDRNPV